MLTADELILACLPIGLEDAISRRLLQNVQRLILIRNTLTVYIPHISGRISPEFPG